MDPFVFNVHKNFTHYLDSSGKQVYSKFTDCPGYWDNAFTDIPHYTCPTDNVNDTKACVIVATQPTHLGDLSSTTEDFLSAIAFQWPHTTKDGRTDYMGRTNFMACAGANSGGHNRTGAHIQLVGCLGAREKKKLDSIPDGTSHTFMHGESLGEIQYSKSTRRYERLYAHSHFTGGLARGRGNVPLLRAPGPNEQLLGNLKRSSWTGFGSAHSAGVNFTMVDGSCHLYTRDIDWQVYYSLCAENDGR